MKLLSSVICLSTCLTGALAQGTIHFVNTLPIFGGDPLAPGVLKNGGQLSDYVGRSLVSGPGYTAQLWFAAGANRFGYELSPASGYSTTTFQTGAGAGFIVTSTELAIFPGVEERDAATYQMRVWDNKGGTINRWEDADALSVARGYSAPVSISGLGGAFASAPFTQFELFGLAAPTPSTSVPDSGYLAPFVAFALACMFRCHRP